MTPKEFVTKITEQDNIIDGAKKEIASILMVYLACNAKYCVGDKVITKKGEAGIISERTTSGYKIRYKVNGITKKGTMSNRIIQYFVSEEDLKTYNQ